MWLMQFGSNMYEGVSKVSLAAWSENCKYSSLPQGTVVSLFCECLVSFAIINLRVAFWQVFVVVVVVVAAAYFIIDSVWKLLDTPLYVIRNSAMRGALLPRPLYSFMVRCFCTVKTLIISWRMIQELKDDVRNLKRDVIAHRGCLKLGIYVY